MSPLHTVILAIVEGLTEFLPISSTGHLIIASSFMGIEKDEFTKLFEVAVQLGAILAVVVLYWKKFFDRGRIRFYVKLLVGVIPAVVLGLLFSKKIDALLESPLTVAISMLVGGIFLVFIDKLFTRPTIIDESKISARRSFIIGIWQCLAMIPGVSRSAASIVGGMQQKLNRKVAAEFSFFLAVPTMIAATGYKLFKAYEQSPDMLRSHANIYALIVGNLIAFVVAMIAIRFFIGFLQRHGFRLFGMYRIVAGILLLVLIWSGYFA
ncbi:MAG TPA: undecaprenyl-diphosphate phosphatase [Puia sp.]|nr:undecaprenyl-diphosphate phosphatase [Puia sp.]